MKRNSDVVVLNINMKKDLWMQLDDFCKKSGSTKTAVVERSVEHYFDYLKNNGNEVINSYFEV